MRSTAACQGDVHELMGFSPIGLDKKGVFLFAHTSLAVYLYTQLPLYPAYFSTLIERQR